MPTLMGDTPRAELGIEARGALRAVVAIAEECDPDRWGAKQIPLDPRKAPPELAGDALAATLLSAVNALAGVGCLSREYDLPAELAERVVPTFTTIGLLATGALAGVEGLPGDPVDAPGWTALLELLEAIEWAAQV